MGVPAAVIHLNEANSLLSKAAGQQALSRKVIVAVTSANAIHLQCLGLLIRDVHEVWHFSLHAECQFVALNDTFNLVIGFVALESFLVEALHQVKLLALRRRGERTVTQVGHATIATVAARGAFHANARSLIHGRQEARAVVLCAPVSGGWIECDEARKILIDSAQSVQRPRSE